MRELKIATMAGLLGVLVSIGMLSLWYSIPQPIGEETRKTFLVFANLIWPASHTMINGTVPSNPRTPYYRCYVPWFRTPLINGFIYSLVGFLAAALIRVTRVQMNGFRSAKFR